jgi:hypothetical protein
LPTTAERFPQFLTGSELVHQSSQLNQLDHLQTIIGVTLVSLAKLETIGTCHDCNLSLANFQHGFLANSQVTSGVAA